jgi:hypothetical protein
MPEGKGKEEALSRKEGGRCGWCGFVGVMLFVQKGIKKTCLEYIIMQ